MDTATIWDEAEIRSTFLRKIEITNSVDKWSSPMEIAETYQRIR